MSLLLCLMLTDSSVSGLHGASALKSPCKGAVLPKSMSMSLSPAVHHGLGSLPSSLPHLASTSSSSRRQLLSPQITKWFRKSTPRKLAVTPKKLSSLTHDTKPHIAGVKRKLCSESDTDESLGVTQLSTRHKVRRPSSENDHRLSPSKPQRTEPLTAASVLTPVESNCSNQVLGETSNSITNAAQFATTSSVAVAGTSYHSPTVNLPNYVYDPQPRAPIGRSLSPVKPRKSCDWLTQLRLERQNNSQQSSPPVRSPAGRGQARRRTTKTSKSSAHVNVSDASTVKESMSQMSPSNTEVVTNFRFTVIMPPSTRRRVLCNSKPVFFNLLSEAEPFAEILVAHGTHVF